MEHGREREEYKWKGFLIESGDTMHKERGDAIHLQPYKKPALLPGDHERRARACVSHDLLTLSHAILSQQLHTCPDEAAWIPRVDSPRRLTSRYVMDAWHPKVEIRMHVVTLLNLVYL